MVWNTTFRYETPVFQGVPGFENVKDTAFSTALQDAQRKSFEAQYQLSNTALTGALQKQINDDTIAYNLQVMNNTNRLERRRMAGALLAGILGGSGGGGGQRQSTEQRANNTLQLLANLRSFAQNDMVAGTGTAALARAAQLPG